MLTRSVGGPAERKLLQQAQLLERPENLQALPDSAPRRQPSSQTLEDAQLGPRRYFVTSATFTFAKGPSPSESDIPAKNKTTIAAATAIETVPING